MAERRIAEQTGSGVVCFISNYSWLDGLSFTGMRERYLEVFDEIRTDNLHGDRIISEYAPDGPARPSSHFVGNRRVPRSARALPCSPESVPLPAALQVHVSAIEIFIKPRRKNGGKPCWTALMPVPWALAQDPVTVSVRPDPRTHPDCIRKFRLEGFSLASSPPLA